nr:MAG TPA: Neck appendage protein [Caudoviricetes sp.]
MIYLKEGQTPLNFAYNDEIVQEGNGKYQLSFKFPTNNPLWEELVEETLLVADDLHGEQEFIIFEVEKHHAYITIYANQVATLLNNYSITEISVNNASGDRVMRSLVSSIIREHKFTFSSDIANTHSLNLKNTTVANAFFKDKHSIIGQWGGDLIRDKYDIRLLSNGGSNKEALFMYKKNLKSYQQKKSIKDLRTRIHFTKTINSQKEGEKDKVIAVTVDSPLIGKYKNIYEGNLDVSDQDVTDEATLRKYGEQYFKTTLCDVIEESIEIDVVGTPDVPVGIFDTVTIFHEKFNLDVKKKITKYNYSPMGRKLKTIGFGKIQSNLGTTLATMVDDAIEEKAETMLDAFKIQKNLAQLLKLDRKGIEDKLVELEEKSKGALEVKKALFEADGTIPDVVKAKILDAVEGDIGRLKTIITEAELIKAIQAKLNYADIKNALIDKAFINQIISDEKFTQQFEDGEVTTQNIFTKLKDSIKSNISKEFVTKDGIRKLVNDLTIDADGIRQITQQESSKVFEKKKAELKGADSYIHKKYSDFSDGRNMSDNSTLKYIGIYTGDKQQAPTNASEYSWTKIKSDGKLYKAYSNSLNGLDFTLVEPDENAKLFAKNRPRVNIVNDNDISDIWQANMFLSFKPNTKYTLTARAKGNNNKLWAYFRNNKTNEEYSWGQLEFRGLETKSITFTTTNDVDDVLFKFVLVPEDEEWTGIQIDWFTIYEGDKRYTDYPVNEPAQYHKYRYFGYVFKESTPVASDFEWFDLQQTSITNDKYTHIVYSDNADGSNFGREPKKYMGVARTTSPTQPTDKTAYKWFKMKGEDGERGRNGQDGKSINRNYITDSKKLDDKYFGSWDKWEKSVSEDILILTKVGGSDTTGFFIVLTDLVKTQFQNEILTWSIDIKGSRNATFSNVGYETNGKKQIDITTNWQRISHTFINKFTDYYGFVFYNPNITFNNGDKIYIRLPKLEKGNVATEWSPAYEDLQAHSLTANLRFEGTYINNITNNVRPYLDVFYDGQKINNGFATQVKYKGGNSYEWSGFWGTEVDSNGRVLNIDWGNHEQNGTPLEVIVLITYKGLNTVANARMENIPDIVEIKEITKKYKTFESTIDKFDSTIGEVKKQVLANEEKRNLIIGSRLLNDSDYHVFGKAMTAEDLQGITAKIYQNTNGVVGQLYNGNPYLYVIAMNNTQPSWQGVGFKLSTNYMQYGSKYSLRIPFLIIREATLDKGIYMEIKNHNTGRVIWNYRLDKQNFPSGEVDTHKGIWIERTATFQLERAEVLSDYSFWIFAVQNGGFCISAPYMCEGDVLPKTYSPAPEDIHLQNSRIESSIKQTKDEIDLKVSKDNVIASINASVETTGEGPAQGVVKINADKVDISGVLSAYIGEIGGFRIGHNPHDNSYWLTGSNNFECGINQGVNVGTRGAQVWAAWGNEWTKAGPNAWWVNAQGVMNCKATPIFNNGAYVPHGVVHYANGTYTYSPNIKKIYMEEENGKTWIKYTVGSVGPNDDALAQYWNYVTMSGSDKRYKTNIKPTEVNGLEIINNLKCYDYDIKLPHEKEKHINCGIMAQDVEIHMNEAHLVYPNGIQSYTPFEMIPYLIKGIQELSEENTNLKSQLKAMNERLTKLEDKINGNI